MKYYGAILVCVWLLGLCATANAETVSLAGTNGRVVEFAGVREANPQGLILLMEEGGEEMLVAWNKFDLSSIKKQPDIYRAYQNAERGETTALNLGIYENMMTEDQFLQSLRQALAQKDKYKIPKLSEFFEHKDDDQAFLSTSKSQDSNAAKRSKRFVGEYTDLIEEFFEVVNEEIYKDTITWNYGSGDNFVIVKEAYPRSVSSVDLSRLHILSYFADDKMKSRSKAVQYLNAHIDEIGPLIGVLEEYKNMAKTKLMADKTTSNRYAYILGKSIEHLQGIRKSTSFKTAMGRTFGDLIREMKLNAGT